MKKATIRGKKIIERNSMKNTKPVSKMTPEEKSKMSPKPGRTTIGPKRKKSPAKKPLVGKQKNLPEELKKKILASPATMKKAAMKMKKESMAMMKKSVAMMKKASAMKMKMKSAAKMKKK